MLALDLSFILVSRRLRTRAMLLDSGRISQPASCGHIFFLSFLERASDRPSVAERRHGV